MTDLEFTAIVAAPALLAVFFMLRAWTSQAEPDYPAETMAKQRYVVSMLFIFKRRI